MLGFALLTASALVTEGALRGSVSVLGAVVTASLMLASVTVENWLAVMTGAIGFLVVITFSQIKTAREVVLAICVALFSACIALVSESLAIRLTYVAEVVPSTSNAIIVTLCMVGAFGLAAVGVSGRRILPFAIVGAALLPPGFSLVAFIWAALGLVYLALPRVRPWGVASLLVVAGSLAFAVLSFGELPILKMESLG